MNAEKVKSLTRVYNAGFVRVDLHPESVQDLYELGVVELRVAGDFPCPVLI